MIFPKPDSITHHGHYMFKVMLFELTNAPVIGSQWREEGVAAFNRVNEDITTSPVSRPDDFSKPFVVETKACGIGIGQS